MEGITIYRSGISLVPKNTPNLVCCDKCYCVFTYTKNNVKTTKYHAEFQHVYEYTSKVECPECGNKKIVEKRTEGYTFLC